MKNSVISTILASLIASAAAGGAFAAEGEYYEGVSPRDHDLRMMGTTDSLGIPHVTRYGYPSMKHPRDLNDRLPAAIDSGDYYEGIARPR